MDRIATHVTGFAEDERTSSAQVLVVVLTTGAAIESIAAADLARWKRLNPSAVWISIDLKSTSPAMQRETVTRAMTEALGRKHMRAGQLVVVGEHEAGRLALELVLEGSLECAGILVIDAPSAPLHAGIVPTTTSVRVVAYEDEILTKNHRNLLSQLRAVNIDERIMMLASTGREDPDATARAAETFLLELVARASRQVNNRGRSSDV